MIIVAILTPSRGLGDRMIELARTETHADIQKKEIDSTTPLLHRLT